MADIPADNYTVTIDDTTNNWANGSLNTRQTPPTYKGTQVQSGYSLDQADVHWSVTLNHQGNDCVVYFEKGVYDPYTKKITGQSVHSLCFGEKLPESNDGWSAEGSATAGP
jgi:hypothetical protein